VNEDGVFGRDRYWYYLRCRVSTDGERTFLFDEPIVNTAYGYTCFYERSFIESGYARANVIHVEQRQNVED